MFPFWVMRHIGHGHISTCRDSGLECQNEINTALFNMQTRNLINCMPFFLVPLGRFEDNWECVL